MKEATWDPDSPDTTDGSAEAPDAPQTSPDGDKAKETDEWGRVRWDANATWDDDFASDEGTGDSEFPAEPGAPVDMGWDEEDFAVSPEPRPVAEKPPPQILRRSSESKPSAAVPASASTPVRPPPPAKSVYVAGADEGDDELTIRKMKSDFDEMDLTPMVDCTFLLLIFFMITASFSLQKTIEVPPPNPDKKGAAQSLQTLDDFKEDSIIVEIDERNVIVIDDEPLTALASLAQVLSNKMLMEKKTELMLMAHDNAWHETVVAVIDSANEVGMQRIRMAAHGGSDD
ncbi:MAG: biopolymer transporter ExbD [Planctomycetota bacterium]|nr:biopolymer transporter ExbD [Planctomycetota bacterium]MDA1215053.1 biopolymer transporter ExbD [Planctomycetota bacterium]